MNLSFKCVVFSSLLVSAVTASSLERPEVVLLNRRVEKLLERGVDGWQLPISNISSLRGMVEELYFSDTGMLLSSVSIAERNDIIKSYLGESYTSLFQCLQDRFEKEQSAGKRLEIASFMSIELLDDSLMNKLGVNYFDLDFLGRSRFLLASAFGGDSSIFSKLEEQVYLYKGHAVRDGMKTFSKSRVLKSSDDCAQYDLTAIKDLMNEAFTPQNIDAFDSMDMLSALGFVQAMRYSGCNDLAFVVALSGWETDPYFILEVFKSAASRHKERDLAESVLLEYSSLERDLSARERRLLKWVCLVIEKRNGFYSKDDVFFDLLGRLAEREEHWSRFASRSLSSLKKEGVGSFED